jgi:hypothetical protein
MTSFLIGTCPNVKRWLDEPECSIGGRMAASIP